MAKRNKGEHPKVSPENNEVGRRVFITGSVATAAASGIAAATLGSSASLESGRAPGNKSEPRYRETEHIRRFYRVSRF